MTVETRDPTVFIVDDNEVFRDSLRWLIASVSLNVEAYAGAAEFLDAVAAERMGCVVADVRMPRISGLELQRMMAERAMELPVIVMTAHGDIDMAVRAMKQGAFDFVQKPFNDQVFLDIVQNAIAESVQTADLRQRRSAARARLALLTPREREVMAMVVEGLINRFIATSLGISEKTFESHRAKVMEKMEANSLAELIKISILLDRHPVSSDRHQGKPTRILG